METLGVLDVDGLDVGVETLLSTLLVVTLARDADTDTEGNTLDTGLPDLLVQLGVEADVFCALLLIISICDVAMIVVMPYHLLISKLLDLLDRPRGSLLEAYAMDL